MSPPSPPPSPPPSLPPLPTTPALAAIRQLLLAQPADAARVRIPAALLPTDGEFVFQLTVRDRFGRHSATARHLLVTASQPLPRVAIAGPPEIEVPG